MPISHSQCSFWTVQDKLTEGKYGACFHVKTNTISFLSLDWVRELLNAFLHNTVVIFSGSKCWTSSQQAVVHAHPLTSERHTATLFWSWNNLCQKKKMTQSHIMCSLYAWLFNLSDGIQNPKPLFKIKIIKKNNENKIIYFIFMYIWAQVSLVQDQLYWICF